MNIATPQFENVCHPHKNEKLVYVSYFFSSYEERFRTPVTDSCGHAVSLTVDIRHVSKLFFGVV